jgi:dTDP-4-amino-4,6-dideoxygalactose transaminase
MSEKTRVPFVDLVTPHLELETELMEAIRGVLRSAGFIGGPILEAFEREFAQFCGVNHCIGVSSGTYLQTQCDRSDGTGQPVDRRSGRVLKAVVPVHLYGQMCDMDPILALADEYRMTVIEDACQAHGAEYFSATSGLSH